MLLMLTDMRDFDAWLAGFRPSIADYKYYVDFDKVFNNVEAIKIRLLAPRISRMNSGIFWYNIQKH